MFRFFKRRKKTPEGQLTIAMLLGHWVQLRQRRLANYLNHRANGWGRTGKLYVLVLSCVVLGGGSLLILVRGLRAGRPLPVDASPYKVPPIRVPPLPAPQNTAGPDPDRQHIRALRKMLDSLAAVPGGKEKIRPGLWDSLEVLERDTH